MFASFDAIPDEPDEDLSRARQSRITWLFLFPTRHCRLRPSLAELTGVSSAISGKEFLGFVLSCYDRLDNEAQILYLLVTSKIARSPFLGNWDLDFRPPEPGEPECCSCPVVSFSGFGWREKYGMVWDFEETSKQSMWSMVFVCVVIPDMTHFRLIFRSFRNTWKQVGAVWLLWLEVEIIN